MSDNFLNPSHTEMVWKDEVSDVFIEVMTSKESHNNIDK